MGQPDIATDFRSGADGGVAAENGGASVNRNIIFDVRVAFDAFDRVSILVFRETHGSERDALIEFNALADDRRFANHDASSVVNEESGTYRSPGMNVDSRLGVSMLRHNAWNQRHVLRIELVGDPVDHNGLEPWVTHDHLHNGASSRVTLVRRDNVLLQDFLDGRQGFDEMLNSFDSVFPTLPAFLTFVEYALILKCALDLFS